MLSVEEALAVVRRWARPPLPRVVPLAQALGCRLAEPIVADLDLPPFDKALMDGFAVRSADCARDETIRLEIGEEISAGRTPTRPLRAREAAFIMTGAPLPEGADAVVMHEKTTRTTDGGVLINGPVREGESRLSRGREMRRDQVLFKPGVLLDAVKLGVLAAVGKDRVRVHPRPVVAIVPTGDELVEVSEIPGPSQIRETNSTVLAGLVRSLGGIPVVHPIARDEPDALQHALVSAMAGKPDILLICGGVSAGNRDLVPGTLESLGVKTVFHKVRLKPGKPLLFGIWNGGAHASARPSAPDESQTTKDPNRDEEGLDPLIAARAEDVRIPDGPRPLVFGLPGNPVSGIVSVLLFVAPVLRSFLQTPSLIFEPLVIPRTLGTDFSHRGDRPTYYPACRVDDGDRGIVQPQDWLGSSDLLTVARADGFVRFEAGDREYRAGETVDFLPFPQCV